MSFLPSLSAFLPPYTYLLNTEHYMPVICLGIGNTAENNMGKTFLDKQKLGDSAPTDLHCKKC